MIVMPAMDLRHGVCVQLRGAVDPEMLRRPSPLDVARHWSRLGFGNLHVVDLDAAVGRGDNSDIVREILSGWDADAQIGGGVRSSDLIQNLLDDGATRVVLAARAIEEPDWLARVAHDFPERLVVAANVRDRHVVSRSRPQILATDVLDLVDELNILPLAAILVTSLAHEGRLAGTDLFLMEDVAERSAHPVFASGGISTLSELRELEDRGVKGTVVGMALYSGALDARQAAEEFVE
jgi:phosphoribosylformimino-5-aminoimidazole carboxamide ribotide isomerase